MFGGKVEIKKDSYNIVFMTRMEDGRLLKLKGTSSHTQNVAYLSHHDVGIMSSSLLWHAIFFHINYDSLCLLRKNDDFGFPTIPRKLKQCDAFILGKIHGFLTFQRDFLEEFIDNVYGIVYFADKSRLKPSGMGTIKLQLHGFLDFHLHNVLYFPELKRSLMPLVHIKQ